MAGDWHALRLGAVCKKIGSGATPRGGSGVYLDKGEVALIRSQNVYNDGFHRDGLVYLTDEHAAELKNVEVEPDDVLLNITGDSVARSCQVASDVLPARVNQHVAIIRADSAVLWPRFLRYVLVSPNMQAKMLGVAGVGATRNALTKGMIESFEVVAPVDVNEQRAIAHILGTLDDKIELNRRMNETLEAIARAIFKSWFVDFDPVRAKASGEPPESICRRLGLTPDILALFPDRLVDSELGEIPEGWEVKPLAQITTYLNRGISPKYVESGGVLVLNQKCVRDSRVDPSKARRHDPTQRSIAGRVLEVGDVLVNSTGVGTLGRVAQVLALDEPTIVDSHVTVVRADPQQVSWNYFGGALLEREAEIKALGEGSTGQTELARGRLGDLKLMVPPEPLRKQCDDSVLSIRLLTRRNEEQSSTLALIRDRLLPKLISGELRVTDAEKYVELLISENNKGSISCL
jgi:type I restriction enzyme S subunit